MAWLPFNVLTGNGKTACEALRLTFRLTVIPPQGRVVGRGMSPFEHLGFYESSLIRRTVSSTIPHILHGVSPITWHDQVATSVVVTSRNIWRISCDGARRLHAPGPS